MSPKKKNDDLALIVYEQSLTARLQRFLRLVKTQEIAIKASPSDCLAWLDFLSQRPPEDTSIVLETQRIKRPYQFGVRIIPQGIGLNGLVVGDLASLPDAEEKSLVELRLYHGIVQIIGIISIFGVSLACGFLGVLLMIDPSNNRLVQCGGIVFVGLCLFNTIGFLRIRYKALHIVRQHLLQLNTLTQKTIRVEMTEAETEL